MAGGFEAVGEAVLENGHLVGHASAAEELDERSERCLDDATAADRIFAGETQGSRADRGVAGVGVRRAQGCRAGAELVHNTIAGNGAGDRYRIALVEVDRARARAESDGRGGDGARGVVGAEAADVQRAGGTGLQAEDDVGGYNGASRGHRQAITDTFIADPELAAVGPKRICAGDQRGVVGGRGGQTKIALRACQRSAIGDEQTASAAVVAKVERVAAGHDRVRSGDLHRVVGGFGEETDQPQSEERAATVGNDETVAAAAAAEAKAASVGP